MNTKLPDTLAQEIFQLDMEIRRTRNRITVWESDLHPNEGKLKLISREYEYLACIKQAKNIYSDKYSRLVMANG